MIRNAILKAKLSFTCLRIELDYSVHQMETYMRWKKAILASIVTTIALFFTWKAFHAFIGKKNMETSYVGEINKLETSGAPDRTFLIDGKEIKLSNIDKPLTLIHFWASWCAPCIDEFPSLMAMSEKLGDKLVIFAISLDESEEEYSAFLKSLEIKNTKNFFVLRDPDNSYAEKFGTEKLPETYILDKNKKLVRKVPTAENWESPQVLEFLEYISDKQ